jgi:hypothetical protein
MSDLNADTFRDLQVKAVKSSCATETFHVVYDIFENGRGYTLAIPGHCPLAEMDESNNTDNEEEYETQPNPLDSINVLTTFGKK